MANKYTPVVEMRAIGKIIPYDDNAKIHTAEQVSRLAKQIVQVGWDVPIVVDKDGVIIKGHGRRLAAIEMGLKKVPVIVRTDLSKADADAARLADNRVAVGDFDTELLQAELLRLSDEDYDLGSLGFDEKELTFLTDDPLDGFDNDAFSGPGDESTSPEVTTDDEMPIAKALGFTSIPRSSLPILKTFMAKVAFETGKVGEHAFVEHAKSVVNES